MTDHFANALQLAERLHKGQVDRNGDPYLWHVLRVACGVGHALPDDTAAQCAALLHDVIEDGRATVDELVAAGVPARAIDLVVALTRRDGEPYFEYIRRVRDYSTAAMQIKLADLRDNMAPDRMMRLAKSDHAASVRLLARYRDAAQLLLRGAA